jgi:hypothetical protein
MSAKQLELIPGREKTEREIRRERKTVIDTVRRPDREFRRRRREAKRRLAERPVEALAAEPVSEFHVGRVGCRACGEGMAEVPVRVWDIDGKPAVGFACRECARYFEKPRPMRRAKEES